MRRLTVCLAFLALFMSSNAALAKVVRKSQYPDGQSALNACSPGDVLLFDGGPAGTLTDPPDDLQIINGSSNWVFTKTVSGLVFFNHTPKITQTGGRLRKCLFTSITMPAKFIGLDSCIFVPIKLNHYCSPCIEVDGFIRYATFLHYNYMGSSTMGLVPSMVDHKSSVVINATNPVGDGSGTLIANIITHSQGDWTPVHIVNGRRNNVAHINSEYTEWADPYVKIENGVECALVQHTPGGRVADWMSTKVTMNDGTLGYKTLSSRNGLFAVSGQANMIIGGQSYVSYRSTITGWNLSDLHLVDPHFRKWNPLRTLGVNLGPSVNNFGYGGTEIGGPTSSAGASSFIMSSAASCTTAFMDSAGTLRTSGLKDKSLPAGPKLLRPYMTVLPRLKLDGDGPGTNMKGKSGSEILTALNAGQAVYLPAGTYTMSGPVTAGAIWGAGKDSTILKFPAGARCLRSGVKAYNVTIEGGAIGWAQTKRWGAIEAEIMNVRFRGQTTCGVTLGNAQNTYLAFLEFDNCNAGVKDCADAEIECGEDGTPGGSSMIDKVHLYGCVFKNMPTGAAMGIGNNGYGSFIGCLFENCGTGIKIVRTKGTNGKCEGHYITACDFVDCGTATNTSGGTVVHNCTVKGKSGSSGFTGDLQAVVSCSITGCEPAVSTSDKFAVISDVTSDGSANRGSSAWVGFSKFTNANCPQGAFVGTTDISRYVNAVPFTPDQTAPSAPKNVKATVSGSDHVVTWDPSSDPESGIHSYIVSLDGARVGWTNFDFQGYPHHGMMHPNGPGTYRNKTRFVHKGAAGKSTNYTVVAVNGARIRSDDQMDMLFMTPNNRFTRPTNADMYRIDKPSDTVVVPQGIPIIKGINKPYLAVRFPPETATGVVDRGAVRPAAARTAAREVSASIHVYDLRGRMVKSVAGTPDFSTARVLSRGVYIVPALRSTRAVTR